MSELLIELFSEEIPSNLQINARKQLENLLKQNLSSSNLEPKTLEIFSTPTSSINSSISSNPLSQ